MHKQEFIRRMNIAGDACVTFTAAKSGKPRYTIATTELTTAYIADKLQRVSNLEVSPDTILVFCWDTDSFKSIDPRRVTKIEPLNTIM